MPWHYFAHLPPYFSIQTSWQFLQFANIGSAGLKFHPDCSNTGDCEFSHLISSLTNLVSVHTFFQLCLCRSIRLCRSSSLSSPTAFFKPTPLLKLVQGTYFISWIALTNTVSSINPFTYLFQIKGIMVILLEFIDVSWPPLWSSDQSSWLLTQRSRVRFPALPDFLSSCSRSGTGSTQPLWG
jgi:hypothetical protein